MHYGLLDNFLFTAYLGVHVVLSITLWRHRRRWIGLFWLTTIESFTCVLLRVVAHNYHTYFNVYWIGSALGAIASLGVLRDVLCAIPGIAHLHKSLRIVFVATLCTVTLVSFFINFQSALSSHGVLAFVLALNESVQTAWFVLSACVLAFISLLGFGWPALPLGVTSGFVLSGLSAMLSAHLIVRWPHHVYVIDRTASVLYLAVFVSWVLCFRKNSPLNGNHS